MLEKAVLNDLRTYCRIKKSDRLLLGFSGGPDSVCLLNVLQGGGFDVSIAYFDHQLRQDSKNEVEFARTTAERYGIEIIIGKADIHQAALIDEEGIEATARKYRYTFLRETAIKGKAKAIAIAHHADDQAETILMHILRGSGLKGLIGMGYRTGNEFTGKTSIIRPMLGIWKDEILAYCEKNALPYMVDETNLQSKYTRNILRNQLIPLIEEINPNMKEGLVRMREIIRVDDEFIDLQTGRAFEECVSESARDLIVIDLDSFRELHLSLQRRLMLMALKQFFSLEKEKQFGMIEDIRSMLAGEQRSKRMLASPNMHVVIEGDVGYIYCDPSQLPVDPDLRLETPSGHIPLVVPGLTPVNEKWIVQTERLDAKTINNEIYENPEEFQVFVDADKTGADLFIRTWRNGDRYSPMGMRGKSMKISDFWINNKFPVRLRKDWPLICDEEDVLWVPGFQPAQKTLISDKTRSILKISFKRSS